MIDSDDISGDGLAFAKHWVQVQPLLTSYLASLVMDWHEVEDLSQEVATVLMRRFGEFDERRGPFKAWALGVARVKAAEWRRKRSSRRMVAVRDPEVMELLAEISADLSEELGDRELAMHKCVETVTGRSREILRLRYVDDLKPAEIARRLSLEAGHVRVILNRIRSALRDCIERRSSGEGATA